MTGLAWWAARAPFVFAYRVAVGVVRLLWGDDETAPQMPATPSGTRTHAGTPAKPAQPVSAGARGRLADVPHHPANGTESHADATTRPADRHGHPTTTAQEGP